VKKRRRSSRDDEREIDDAAPAVRLHPTGGAPERIPEIAPEIESADSATLARHLGTADHATRTRVIRSLQRDRGNAFVQEVVRGIAAQQAVQGKTQHGGSGAGTGRGETLTLERDVDDDEGPIEAPIALDDADIPVGATESIGPETSSSYGVAAVSLNDFATQVSGRDEAGHADWKELWNYRTTGNRITSVIVTVAIDVEMPNWAPPPSMRPRARAEWDRWYAALLAHEQGHVKLVHDKFDGLASRILGKTVRAGGDTFNTAKAELRAASRAYDGRTAHGLRTGTIIDTSIEDREIADAKKEEDEKRKKEAAKRESKAEADVPAVPDGPAAG
jgi:hypothetical protein